MLRPSPRWRLLRQGWLHALGVLAAAVVLGAALVWLFGGLP
jgi:hypothetical protein